MKKIINKVLSLLKKEEQEDPKMDLFNKPPKKTKKSKTIVEEPEEIEEEFEQPVYNEREQLIENTKTIDKTTADVEFKILVRTLNEYEKQIKSGKPTMVDESKRDKIPSVLTIINQAELLKLKMKGYIEAFKDMGYSDDELADLKQKALNPKEYLFYTL